MQRTDRESAKAKMNKGFLVWVAMLLFASVHGSAQGRYEAKVSGTVVDANGNPVRAAITFHNSRDVRKNQCWVRDTTVGTDAQGRFVHNEHCGVQDREIILFIKPVATGSERALLPIYPPYWDLLRETNPRFAGMKVRLRGNEDVDLGNISVPISFGNVELFVLNKTGKPLYKTLDAWSRFLLIVRDAKGNAIGEEALSIRDLENSVSLERGSVLLELPEGTWTLELYRSWDDFDQSERAPRYLAATVVVIDRRGNQKQASLTVR